MSEAFGTPAAIDFPIDSKHAAELTAIGLVPRGLPVVIVNPAYVLGAGDPELHLAAAVRRSGRSRTARPSVS